MKIIAVSGGVDSMVLLYLYRKEQIAVVHINHHTRKEENEKEEKLVKKVCQENDIPFYKFDYIHQKEKNFQQAAREYRYQKLLNIAQKYKSKIIMTAHHKDDQVENILMNENKIAPKLMQQRQKISFENEQYEIIRPLLTITKKQIYQYAQKKQILYLEDSSNSSLKYKRNKIRNQISKYSLAKKEEIYKQEEQRIIKYFDKYWWATNTKEKKNSVILKTKLTNQYEIYIYLKQNMITSNISKRKIQNIQHFLEKNKNGKISIDMENILIVEYEYVKIINRLQEEKNKLLPKVKKQKLKIGKNEFNKLIFNVDEELLKKLNYLEELNQLQVRIPKVDDRIKLLEGSKKISRFLIDQKIPLEQRKIWPIISWNNQLIYVFKKKEVKIK